jgi:hypothetical protein
MTRCKGTLLLAVAFATWVGGASQAVAQDQPRSKFLVLRVSSNNLPAEEATALTQGELAKLAKYPQFDVLKVPDADPMDLMVDADCVDFDAQCLANIGAGRGADVVLYTEVSDQAGRFNVQMRLVDVTTKAVKSPEGGAEESSRLGEFIANAIEKMLGPEPQPEPELLKVDIASTPAGGEVYVDKDFVGLTPVAVRLKTGDYTLRISKVGYKETVQPLKVEGRKANVVSLNLNVVDIPKTPVTPVPTKEREVKKTPWYGSWWFWTIVGAAVVGGGTAAGVVLSKTSGGGAGSIGLSPDARYAPKDVTLFPR